MPKTKRATRRLCEHFDATRTGIVYCRKTAVGEVALTSTTMALCADHLTAAATVWPTRPVKMVLS